MKKSSTKTIPNQRIFLGRIEEQKRFRTILEEFQATGSKEEFPHVILISGDAGMGKTSLKRRFQDIVQKESPFAGKFKVLTLDWADERKKMPGLQVARDHIEAQIVFRAVHNEAIRRKWGRQFMAYNKAIKAAHEVDKQVAEVLAASSNEDEIAILRRAGVPAIARIVRWRAPFIGEAGEQIIESLLGAGIQVAAEQLTNLNNRLHVYLQANLKPNHFDYFLNPNEQLANQLARGLENVAKSKRLVVLMDSYEIVDRNDIWIRSVIREAGPRVLWVICGRNELVHSRQFGDEFFKGYADDWPRHLASFSMWPLSVADISEYFNMQGRNLSKEEVNSLSMVTRGRPLAVHEAAAVISAGEPLEEVLTDMMKVGSNDKIMRSMTDSYLKHVVAEDDRKAIYALVLARGDVETLRAMLTPEGQKRFNLEKLLQRLERDYSTVMADHARLHDEHSEFVHEYLKNELHRSSVAVQELVGKAVTFLREKLIKIETDLELLEERCKEDNWVQAVVNLVQYLLWVDERDTFMFALPRFVEGLAYNKKLCQAILRSLEEWYDQLSSGGREIFNGLNVLDSKFISVEEEAYLLDTLSRMEERGWLNGDHEPGGRKERQAIKHLRDGNHAFKQKQYSLARERFAQVEDGLPEGGLMLRTQLAEALSRMAQVLSMPDGREARYNPESDTLLERANHLLPEEHWTWFELGLVRQMGNKPADALAAYERAAELNPKHEVTRLHIGDALLALERHDEAIESYDQASKMKTGFAAPRIGLGDVYLALGDLSEAEKFYKRALKIDEKALDAWQKLGDLYSQQGKLEEAQAAFQNAGTIRPSSGTADIGRAKILYDRGETDKAEAALETAREKGEITAELHLLQGYIDRDRGDLTAAVNNWTMAAELDPDNAEAVLLLGEVYEELGRENEAIALYRAAVNRQTDFSEGWHHLAEALQRVGRHRESAEIYTKLQTLEPEAETLYRQAQSNFEVRNYLDALEAFTSLVETFPDFAPGWSGLGHTHTQISQNDEAIAAFEKAIALDPTRPEPFIGLGWIELKNKRPETAEQNFRQALAGDENSIEAQCGLAEVKMAVQRYEDAKQIFSRIWRNNPQNIDALIGLGRVAVISQEFAEAADIWQQALEMNQNHPAIYTGRGEVYHHKQRPGLAIRAFERAIEVDSNYAPAYRAMGDTFHGLGQMDNALAAYRKARGIDLTVFISPINLGDVLTSLGRYGEALESYQKALNPVNKNGVVQNSDSLYIGLGNVYTALGRLEEAREAFEMAMRLNAYAINALLGLGKIHIILKNYHEGRMVFEDALELQPDSAEAHNGLGEIDRLEGSYSGAITSYRNAISQNKRFAPAHLGLAKVFLAQRDLDMAEKSARVALQFGEKMPAACDLLGEIARRQSRIDDAKRYYEQAIGMDDTRAQTYGGLGLTYIALNQNAKALEWLETGLEKEDVDEHYPYLELGRLYHESHLFQKAEAIYDMALRIGVNDPLVFVGYGDLAQDLEQYTKSMELYQQGLTLSRESGQYNPKAWHGTGRLHLKQKRYEDAIKSFEEAMSAGLRSSALLVDMADACRGSGSLNNARRYYERAIQLDNNNVLAHLGMGLTYQAEGMHEESLKYLEKARRLDNSDSSNLQIAISMGQEQLDLDQPEKAKQTFSQLLETAPDRVEGYIGIAQVALTENDLERSMDSWKSALRLEPDNPKALKGFGEVLVRQGKSLQALEMFREATKSAPKWGEAQQRLGDLLVQQKQYEDAQTAYKKAVDADQNDVQAWCGLGRSNRHLGELGKAEEHLKQALRLKPNHLMTLSELVRTYIADEQWQNALGYLHRLIQLEPQVAQHHIETGHVLQQIGRLEEASGAYRRGLKIDRSLAAGWIGLGEVFDFLGHTEPAKQAFRSALSAGTISDCERAAALTGVALIQQHEGDLEEAVNVYAEALTHNDKHTPAYIGIGEVYARQGDGQNATVAFKHAISLTPNHPRALTGLGEMLRLSGDAGGARNLFNQALNSGPNWIPALTGLGRAWYDEGEMHEALAFYEMAEVKLSELSVKRNLRPQERLALRSPEQRVFVQIGLGDVALADGRIDEAVDHFRQAIRISPQYVKAFTGLGFALEKLNRPEEALAVFHTALEIDPDEPAAYMGMGDVATSRGQEQQAIELYEQALMLVPDDEALLLRLGKLYAEQSNSDPAIPLLEQLANKPTSASVVNRMLGELYTDREQHDSAVQAYQKAVDADGSEVRSLSGLGWARLRQSDAVRASQAFANAIKINQSDPNLFNGLGRSYTALEQPERAIQMFDQALRLDQKTPVTIQERASIYTARGFAQLAMNDSNAAIRDFDQARRIDGKFGEAEMGRGHLYAREERFNDAIAAYERAVLFNYKSADLFLNLGRTFLYTNRPERARDAFSKAIHLDPNNAAAHAALGDVYREEGEFEDAMLMYKRSIKLDSHLASGYGGLADLFHEKRDSDRAIALYTRAIELNPEDGISHGRLAGLYRKQGSQEKYEQAFHTAQALIPITSYYNRACLESIRGNVNEAVKLLRRGLHLREIRPEWIHRDPDFDFIRNDDRFSTLISAR